MPKPVDRTQRVLTDGSPVPEDQSHTTLKPNGQQEGYIVLTEEERAKGFVRPVRRSYRHVGLAAPEGLRDITDAERERHGEHGYVKYQPYGPERAPMTGRFWTQADLDRVNAGCGTVTTMSQEIAETFARDPSFYGGTFCCGCGKHLPLAEFRWVDNPDQQVGS